MTAVPYCATLAGRLSGRPAAAWAEDPVAWAYALRDACQVLRPDVLVPLVDPSLEASALRASGDADDLVDLVLDAPPLATLAPVSAHVELVATLCGIPGLPPVVPHVQSPGAVARALGDADEELADVCADALASLVGAYADTGVRAIALSEAVDGGPLQRVCATRNLTVRVTGADLQIDLEPA